IFQRRRGAPYFLSKEVRVTHNMDEPVRLPWWRTRRAMTAAIALLAVSGLAVTTVLFLGSPKSSLRLPASNVSIDPVSRGVFHDLTALEGRVAPKDVIYLDALEGGQVQRVLVQAGDRITVGQPLVEFRNTQLELDVLSEEGRLVESITQLQTLEKQL